MAETEEKSRALRPRENAFVLYYVGQALRNGGKAAKLAGYNGKDDTLKVTACNLLKQPHIRAAIDELLTANALSATEVLSELADIAKLPLFVSVPTKELDEEGKPKEVIRPNKSALIKHKLNALTVISRYHGMLIDRVRVDVDVTKLSDEELEAIVSAEG